MTQTQLSQETEPMKSAAASTSANWERRGSAKHSQPRPPLVDHPTTHKVRGWLVAKRISLAWAVPLLAITAIVRLINLGGSPQRVDDEGTYVAQAYAVSRLGELSHYTYWYDHPPLGWIQIAVWEKVTLGFSRYNVAVLAGREFIVVAGVVAAAMLFILARRLRLSRPAAGAAVLILALSPLAVQYQRMVFLDNVATPWLLAAFVLALAPSRQLAAFAGAAICFSIAVLSKETYFLFLPFLGWQMWRMADRGTRRYTVSMAAAIVVVLGLCYVLMATLKGELIPGTNRVSLASGIGYQLVGRQSSGSLFQSGSQARATLEHWMLDPAILVAGFLAALLLLRSRRFAPIASAIVFLVVFALRPGYLPVPYVIALLPFFALLIPAAVEVSIKAALASSSAFRQWLQIAATGVAAALAFVIAAPMWAAQAPGLLRVDHDQPMRQAETYVKANIGHNSRLIVDDSMWLDLVEAGFQRTKVVWYHKVDTDPEVAGMAPNGWRDYDYVISTNSIRTDYDGAPIVAQALTNSVVVASFGDGEEAVTVYRVHPEGGKTAEKNEELDRLDRIAAGKTLARSDALLMSSAARTLVVNGRVDARILLALRRATSVGTVTIDAIPPTAGAEEARRPRRQVRVTKLNGQLATQSIDMKRLIGELERHNASYAPADITRSAGGGLLVSYTGDAPARLLRSPGGS
jgi:4-amino-4-deoxy-L-arabinose transferase-like glycosyltransferase